MKKLIYALIILLLAPLAFAQENTTEENQTEPVLDFEITEFDVEGEASVASTLNLKLTIKNTGDLDIVGANAMLTLPDGTVTDDISVFIGDLQAGDEVTVTWPVFVISEGDFTFDVDVTTGNGLTETSATTITASVTEVSVKLPPGLVRKDTLFRPPGLVMLEARNEIFAGNIFYPLKKIIAKRIAKEVEVKPEVKPTGHPSVEKNKAPKETKKEKPSESDGKSSGKSDDTGKPSESDEKSSDGKTPGSKSKSKKKQSSS